MDPVTIGVVGAALAQKAFNRAEDGAVDAGTSAVRKLIAWLRVHLQPEGQQALARLENAPDSATLARRLAGEIDTADRDADTGSDFTSQLRNLIDEVRKAGVDIDGVINQAAWGNQNVQIANTSGEVNVQYGQADRAQ